MKSKLGVNWGKAKKYLSKSDVRELRRNGIYLAIYQDIHDMFRKD